ncbi:MAG TPA: hypothetical protein VMF65_22335 [Acidimicrobiales bacterium]|nr:hypothetical protein [Acidimicrobiales bacterium]
MTGSNGLPPPGTFEHWTVSDRFRMKTVHASPKRCRRRRRSGGVSGDGPQVAGDRGRRRARDLQATTARQAQAEWQSDGSYAI